MQRPHLVLSKATVFSIHLIIWVCIFGIVPVIRYVSGDPVDLNYFLNPFFIVFHVYIVGLFYLNSSLIVPFVLYKRGAIFYILTVLCCVAVMATIIYFCFPPHHGGHMHHRVPPFLFGSAFPGLFVCAVSTTYRILGDRMRSEQKINELENEQLKTELSFLRSQVSPHFMFNVLNNIVSLSRKKSELVEPTIIQLSNLMRYMLYESDADKVFLDKEVEYLRSYIDLQKLRFGAELPVSFEVNNASVKNTIEPMLLIPFVENAFKHGTVGDGKGIDIELKTWEEQLLFVVRNSFNSEKAGEKDDRAGIGLVNVRRRLNLLYGTDHSLEISQKEGIFTVILKLKLK